MAWQSAVSALPTGWADWTLAADQYLPRAEERFDAHPAAAGGSGHRLVVGSGRQVADDLEDWFAAGAADGFTVMGADTGADFENFVRHVVPVLQARGLFHRDYEGVTLRENYGLPQPGQVARPAVSNGAGRA